MADQLQEEDPVPAAVSCISKINKINKMEGEKGTGTGTLEKGTEKVGQDIHIKDKDDGKCSILKIEDILGELEQGKGKEKEMENEKETETEGKMDQEHWIPLAPSDCKLASKEIRISIGYILFELLSRLSLLLSTFYTSEGERGNILILMLACAVSLINIIFHVLQIISYRGDINNGIKVANSAYLQREKALLDEEKSGKPEEGTLCTELTLEYAFLYKSRHRDKTLFIATTAFLIDPIVLYTSLAKLILTDHFFSMQVGRCVLRNQELGEFDRVMECYPDGLYLQILAFMSCSFVFVHKTSLFRAYFWTKLNLVSIKEKLVQKQRLQTNDLHHFNRKHVSGQEISAVSSIHFNASAYLPFEDPVQVPDLRILGWLRDSMNSVSKATELARQFHLLSKLRIEVRQNLLLNDLSFDELPGWAKIRNAIPFYDCCDIDIKNRSILMYCYLGDSVADFNSLHDSITPEEMNKLALYVMERNLILVEEYSKRHQTVFSVRILCDARGHQRLNLSKLSSFSNCLSMAKLYPFRTELTFWRPGPWVMMDLPKLFPNLVDISSFHYSLDGLQNIIDKQFIPKEIGGNREERQGPCNNEKAEISEEQKQNKKNSEQSMETAAQHKDPWNLRQSHFIKLSTQLRRPEPMIMLDFFQDVNAKEAKSAQEMMEFLYFLESKAKCVQLSDEREKERYRNEASKMTNTKKAGVILCILGLIRLHELGKELKDLPRFCFGPVSCLKFLRATKYDKYKSCQSILSFILWRVDQRLDKISDEKIAQDLDFQGLKERVFLNEKVVPVMPILAVDCKHAKILSLVKFPMRDGVSQLVQSDASKILDSFKGVIDYLMIASDHLSYKWRRVVSVTELYHFHNLKDFSKAAQIEELTSMWKDMVTNYYPGLYSEPTIVLVDSKNQIVLNVFQNFSRIFRLAAFAEINDKLVISTKNGQELLRQQLNLNILPKALGGYRIVPSHSDQYGFDEKPLPLSQLINVELRLPRRSRTHIAYRSGSVSLLKGQSSRKPSKKGPSRVFPSELIFKDSLEQNNI